MSSSPPRLAPLLLSLAPLALASACTDDEATPAELPPAGLAGGANANAPRDGGAAAPKYDGLMALPREENIVTVGELAFTRADLERSMIHTAARVGLPPGQLAPEAVAALELPAFKQLLKRGLLFAEAQRRGLAASDDEVKAEKDRLIAKLPEGRTLADVLENMRTDEATFERDLKIDLSAGKLMQKVYEELPKVDEKRARELYRQDKERWASDDRVSVSHLLVAVAPTAPPTAVDQAHKRAEALREKVAGKDKATFAKVAREESDDPSAKQNGGDLGWFSRREMLPGLAEAAFALKEGEVSPVVRSDRGFHVLFGQGRKKQTVAFDAVKERIVATELIAQRTEAEQALLARLEESVKMEIHHAPRGVPSGGAPTLTGDDAATPPHGALPAAGAAAMKGGDHMAIPLPSKDNVLPGAHNPHGGDLKLDGASGGDLKLKLKLGTSSTPGAVPPPAPDGP